MYVWTIGYSLKLESKEVYYIEVFAVNPFEAYRNGWEMVCIYENKMHEDIFMKIIQPGSIEENKIRFKIAEENVIKKI